MKHALEVLGQELKRQEYLYEACLKSPLTNGIHMERYKKRVKEIRQAIKIIKEHDQALNFMNN